MGLVNVPIKLYTMIRDESFSFKYVRKEDACPLKYQRVCTLDEEIVDWDDVAQGYEVRKGEFVVFDRDEIKALRPSSDNRIKIDKFVPMDSVDRIYLDKSYILTPDKSGDAYGLLLSALVEMNMAGVGSFTMRTKEYPALIHVYRDSIIVTTLRYANEVVDPRAMEAMKEVKEPSDQELGLAVKIIENLSGDFDITQYNDTFRDRVQELVDKKMKGETIVVEEPKKEEVKELMAALQETLKQLQSQ
jgi:DNA end-binding protein Ku